MAAHLRAALCGLRCNRGTQPIAPLNSAKALRAAVSGRFSTRSLRPPGRRRRGSAVAYDEAGVGLVEARRLCEARGGGAGELQRQMLPTQYNLSCRIDRLEQAGYTERRACDDDGRGQIIVITTAGRDIRRRMWAVTGPQSNERSAIIFRPSKPRRLMHCWATSQARAAGARPTRAMNSAAS